MAASLAAPEPAERAGQGTPNSTCSAQPSQGRAGRSLAVSGGHAASSPAISANPLSLFGRSRRARDSAQPEEPSWNTGTSIAPPSRAHRTHSNCRARTARGGSSGGRGGPQADRGTAAGPGETPAHDPEEHLCRLLMIAKRMRRLHPLEYRSLPPQSASLCQDRWTRPFVTVHVEGTSGPENYSQELSFS